VPTERADRMTEEDVGLRLEAALAGDDPGAMRRLRAWTKEALEDGRFRLLHLEEPWVVIGRAVEEGDERA
jgi:hypothetical protein